MSSWARSPSSSSLRARRTSDPSRPDYRRMAQWKLHRLADQPREKMMAGIERRFVSGERSTVGQIWLAKGALVPEHTHESEHVSYIIEGALRFTLGGKDVVTVNAGEIIVIPSMLAHSRE